MRLPQSAPEDRLKYETESSRILCSRPTAQEIFIESSVSSREMRPRDIKVKVAREAALIRAPERF